MFVEGLFYTTQVIPVHILTVHIYISFTKSIMAIVHIVLFQVYDFHISDNPPADAGVVQIDCRCRSHQ